MEQQPSSGIGKIAKILDYPSAEMGPHTETLYVPDLTQGEFQPLEELDDEVLSQMDLNTIISKELGKLNDYEQQANVHGNTQTPPKIELSPKKTSPRSQQAPPLLKLHKLIQNCKPAKECVFLCPVTPDEVDQQGFKR